MKIAKILFFLIALTATQIPLAKAGISNGHINLVNGSLEVHVDDASGSSRGINDLLDLFLAEGFDVDNSNIIDGSQVFLISSGTRIPNIALYGVIYEKEGQRQIVKARITVPATDKFWTSFSPNFAFMSFEGAGAQAIYQLLEKHGKKTMDDDRITRYESGEVLCYARHEDGGHFCFIDL